MTGTGQRPEQHDHRKTAMGSEDVHQLATPRIHQRVGEQKCGLESGELPVRQRDVSADSLDCDRQRLSIKIADCDCRTHQDGDSPPQIRLLPSPIWFHSRRITDYTHESSKRLLIYLFSVTIARFKVGSKEVDRPAWPWKVIGQSMLRVTAWSVKQL